MLLTRNNSVATRNISNKYSTQTHTTNTRQELVSFEGEASDALSDEMNDIWLENQTRSLRKSGRNLFPSYGLHALLMNFIIEDNN